MSTVQIIAAVIASSASIGGTLIFIGFYLGSIKSKFVHSAEYREDKKDLHKRIDQVLNIVTKINVNLAELKGAFSHD